MAVQCQTWHRRTEQGTQATTTTPATRTEPKHDSHSGRPPSETTLPAAAHTSLETIVAFAKGLHAQRDAAPFPEHSNLPLIILSAAPCIRARVRARLRQEQRDSDHRR
eukprot:523124-Rhodomonas_salina.3